LDPLEEAIKRAKQRDVDPLQAAIERANATPSPSLSRGTQRAFGLNLDPQSAVDKLEARGASPEVMDREMRKLDSVSKTLRATAGMAELEGMEPEAIDDRLERNPLYRASKYVGNVGARPLMTALDTVGRLSREGHISAFTDKPFAPVDTFMNEPGHQGDVQELDKALAGSDSLYARAQRGLAGGVGSGAEATARFLSRDKWRPETYDTIKNAAHDFSLSLSTDPTIAMGAYARGAKPFAAQMDTAIGRAGGRMTPALEQASLRAFEEHAASPQLWDEAQKIFAASGATDMRHLEAVLGANADLAGQGGFAIGLPFATDKLGFEPGRLVGKAAAKLSGGKVALPENVLGRVEEKLARKYHDIDAPRQVREGLDAERAAVKNVSDAETADAIKEFDKNVAPLGKTLTPAQRTAVYEANKPGPNMASLEEGPQAALFDPATIPPAGPATTLEPLSEAARAGAFQPGDQLALKLGGEAKPGPSVKFNNPMELTEAQPHTQEPLRFDTPTGVADDIPGAPTIDELRPKRGPLPGDELPHAGPSIDELRGTKLNPAEQAFSDALSDYRAKFDLRNKGVGDPFATLPGAIRDGARKKAVERYKDWLAQAHPNATPEMIEHGANVFGKHAKDPNFWRTYDAALQVWKRTRLHGNFAWESLNTVEDTVKIVAAGFRDPRSFVQAVRARKEPDGFIIAQTPSGRNITAGELRKIYREAGAEGSHVGSKFEVSPDKASKLANLAVDIGSLGMNRIVRPLAEGRETLFKQAFIVDAMKKGMSPRAAATRMDDVLFNTTLAAKNKSIREHEKTIKRFSPFAGYHGRAISNLPKLALRNPFMATLPMKVGDALQANTPVQDTPGDYVTSSGTYFPLGAADTPGYSLALQPRGTLLEGLNPLLNPTMENTTQFIGPPLSLMIHPKPGLENPEWRFPEVNELAGQFFSTPATKLLNALARRYLGATEAPIGEFPRKYGIKPLDEEREKVDAFNVVSPFPMRLVSPMDYELDKAKSDVGMQIREQFRRARDKQKQSGIE
jgi:hypothetical protein